MSRRVRQQSIPASKVSYSREANLIAEKALSGVTSVVSFGPLVFFSIEKGDAWMLDPADGFALCLARGGERLPARILETKAKLVVEWTCDYRIDGDLFVFAERKSGRIVSVFGYPTDEIARACIRVR
ncbi:MAG: hypothetical protein HYZ53_12385 [Planctomycetes bacterium]|nr:hypothetical protein [Planctomycetota bacterium]